MSGQPGDQPGDQPGQPSRPHVVVVGAGVSGLTAARRLATQRPDLRVTVLEAAQRVGGSLLTAEVGGVQVDVGAEAMLNRRPEAVALVRDTPLADDLVHPATTSASLWNRGRLVPLPRTLMGVPLDLGTVGDVLSPEGVARARRDTELPPTLLGEDDVSVGDLVEQRLGAEVVDRLVEPLLGGVYAGHARRLSARAAVPQLVALLERDTSLVRAAAAAVPPLDPATAPPVFAGVRGGIGRLPAALAATPGVRVRTGATVRRLAHRAGGGWELVVGSARDPEQVLADAVVLATPARATARLLGEVAPVAASLLAEVETASMAVVTLAFRARDLPTTVGSGVLVPPVDGHRVKAATFSFAKWGWVREAGEGADPVLVLRCSLGRHREEQVLQRSDEELVALALADLGEAIGLVAAPVDTHVQRWGGALPQYFVGHLARVASVRRALEPLPGLEVCGSTYDGVGIPACVASAERAVAEVLSAFGTMAS